MTPVSIPNTNLNVIGPNWPSLNKLIEALKDRVSTKAYKTVNYEPVNLFWGTSKRLNIAGSNLNNIPKISNYQQLQYFQHRYIQTPYYTDYRPSAKDWVYRGSLVWGRTFDHMKGRDIVGPGPRARDGHFNKTWLNRDYWVIVIPPEFDEYRVHVFQNEILSVCKKVKTNEETRIQPVRNRQNGWTLQRDLGDIPAHQLEEIRTNALKAVGALGYTFGAVDLIYISDNNPHRGRYNSSVVVLEVNKAPGLDDRSARVWAKAIGNYVNKYLGLNQFKTIRKKLKPQPLQHPLKMLELK